MTFGSFWPPVASRQPSTCTWPKQSAGCFPRSIDPPFIASTALETDKARRTHRATVTSRVTARGKQGGPSRKARRPVAIQVTGLCFSIFLGLGSPGRSLLARCVFGGPWRLRLLSALHLVAWSGFRCTRTGRAFLHLVAGRAA